MLTLGMGVAAADGVVDAEELARLTEQIEAAFELSPQERRRLEAQRTLLAERGGVGGDAMARRIAKSLAPASRQSVGRLLVAIAAADGKVDERELAALARCFKAMDLAPELLDETVKALTPGEADAPLRLDREAISAIMAETREVSRLLAEAMAVEESAPAPEVRAAAAEVPAKAGRGPAGRYRAFYDEVVVKDRWSEAEAAELARRHGVMLSGAVEAINDWAFEALGAPLIEEEGGAVVVDRSLL